MFISSFSAYCLDIPHRRPPPVSDHFVVHQGWSLTRELTFLFCHAVAYEGFDCILWNMEGWKLSLSIGVDSGIFTCIEGSTPRRAWGQGGWVADRPPATRWGRGLHIKTPQWGLKKRGNAPPRDNTTNTHNRKNGGNIYNAGNCGISIVMKIFWFIYVTENSGAICFSLSCPLFSKISRLPSRSRARISIKFIHFSPARLSLLVIHCITSYPYPHYNFYL